MFNYDKYINQYGDLFYKQLELESECKKEAENSLRLSLEKAKREGTAGQSNLGEKFAKYAWDSCRDNIKALITDVQKPKKTTQGYYVKPMKDLISIYREQEDKLEELITLIGLSVSVNKIFTTENSVSEIAFFIGSHIKAEADIEAFYQWEQANKGTDLKWLKSSMEKGISQRVQESYKIVYAVNRMNKEGYTRITWSRQEAQMLGAKILESIIKGSGYFKTVKRLRNEKKITCLAMTEWFEKAWFSNENHLLENAIHYKPTIIPPKHWTSPTEGAYYGESMLLIKLLRLKFGSDNIFTSKYQKKLETVDLSNVYDALNAMQDTPFIINKDILQVMKDIYASGGNLGGLPQTEPFTISKAPDTATEEEIKEHKKHLVAIYKQEEVRKSHALRLLMALKTAEKFAAYDKIYFPWNMDYRGRCYPIPTALSPQGDDISKSLLLFAEPSECQHKDDYKWMAIHGANLAGNDKINFADRVKWVEDNTDNIINSAEDALGYQWWYEVSKGDYPMEFLAFCFEWKKLKTYMSTHNNSCVGFKSGLALAFDGTCSGLQHFSALLRDEIGGKAVNLIPSDTVQDIYSIVAEKVNKVLLKDAISGTEDELKPTKDGKLQANKNIKYGTKTLALNWTTFNDMKFGQKGITRKVCKRSVMTLAYGSRQYGFKENILEDIIKPFVLDHPEDSPFLNKNQAAVYMVGLIWDAVVTTVVKAVEGMEWLQQIAGLICSNSKVVTWCTPNGLPIQQNYMVEEEKKVQLRFNSARVRFYTNESTGNINIRGQKNGISPNFIHSMDACHLQRVVVAEHKLGNRNFAMIHDSFGTDIAHAGSLYKTIRQEFIGLYKDQNHLENFLNDVKYLIADDAEIPELPKFGNLNIDNIANSDFCFA
ncbi:DNA-directed RNA polymerase [Pectinatus frisingensis]|uniref:DNA-directed RNA polymerase n=1 Tax=Pectinatus frisingensis TaxID=865 RepID=UPI0018C8478A|nr:DNA-directed RNA polymerase [Pectinatus frisingensis]